jgi:hypothetical protein
MNTLSPFRLLSIAMMGAATLVFAQGETPPAGAASRSAASPAPTVPADARTSPGAPAVPNASGTGAAAASTKNSTAATPTNSAAPTATAEPHLLPAPDPSSELSSTLAGSLASSTAVAAIQRQELDQRDQLLKEIDHRVQTADRKIGELKQKAAQLDANGQQSMQTAVTEYERSKTRLEQSFDRCRDATATTWERARSALATNYAFFVAAVAGVEVAAPNI